MDTHEHPIIIRTKHKDLTLEELGRLLPGPGMVMPDISRRAWVLFYAAGAKNWKLATYQLKQMKHRFALIQTTRPKMVEPLDAFLSGPLARVEAAVEAQNHQAFTTAFATMVSALNGYHNHLGHPEIVWKLPPLPPEDLVLEPQG